MELQFKGEGVEEKAYLASIDENSFRKSRGSGFRSSEKRKDALVEVDPAYFRPTEVELLIGDATKARTQLGWEPSTI